MKIDLIVGGKFHAFNLAEQINKRGYLNKITTSYPSYKLKKFNINNDQVKSYILKEVFSRILLKLPIISSVFDIDGIVNDFFDRTVSNKINLENIDIIVGWSGFSKNSFLKAAKFKCKKVLERGSAHILFQNEILKKEFDFLKINKKFISQRVISKELEEYNMADYIVVPSNFARKTFLDKGFSKDKIINIPLGVDLKKFDLDKTVIGNKIKENKFRIISTGSLSIRKGTYYLLETFVNLNIKNSELLLVGNIDKDFQVIFDRYKNNKNIKHYNSQPERDLKKFYNISDIFVSCSLEDGFSMVQLQAMACGLPIITTYNTGASELINNGEEGFVLPIKNMDLLGDKINILYKNKQLRNEMSNKSFLKAKNNLSWDAYGKNIINFYKKILS